MSRSQMANNPSFVSRVVFFATVSLAACGTLSQPTPPASAPAASARAAPEAPAEGLTEATLYDLLLGEIALQRGDAALAAQTYLDVAKRTRDPRVVRRAVEVANFARLPELAIEAA